MTGTASSTEELVRRLEAHPQLRDRFASLLAVVEDEAGDLKRADDAEMRVIEEIRRMGQEALQAWAVRQVDQVSAGTARLSQTWREGKKNSAGTPPLATSA